MQGRAGDVLRRGRPGEHRHPLEAAMAHGLAEEHAGRLVMNADVDADGAPLALKHLLAELARLVAGRRQQFDLQPDRKVVGVGKSVSVGVVLGCRRFIQKINSKTYRNTTTARSSTRTVKLHNNINQLI